MKKITILTLLFFCFPKIHSQSSQWTYVRPSNSGLGGDYYQCIEVDACGNKWTGGYLPFWSEGSVTRFDGEVFTNWSNFEGYLPADRVYDVAFDSSGGLWVATNGVGNGVEHGGISHFDGSTWSSFTSLNTPMPLDDMRGIVVDHSDVVWATFYSTADGIGGVARYDGATWTIYQQNNSGLPGQYADKIDVDAQNNIWIGTDLGLVKFDGTTWTLYNTSNSEISSNIIRDVEVDETNNKIYAVTPNSIEVFDNGTWSHINSGNAPISATALWAIDAKGDKMIITTTGGPYLTYIYDGTGWITHQEPDHTYDARIDLDGNFWTAGIGVVAKFDGTSWTNYGSKNTGLTGMFNDDIFIDSDNRAWFASNDNGGINMFDCPKWQDYNPYNGGLWPQPITYTGSGSGITEDSAGDIWMVFSGVAGGVVQIPNGNVDNPAAWTIWENDNSGISLQFASRAAADQSGNVWIGYDGACSVSRYSHATNSWTNYNLYQLGQISCGAGSGIKSIRVDTNNNVWICGLAGLAKFDQVAWTFYSDLNTPLQGIVMDIAFDAQGNKWVATEFGLYKFDNTTWTHYDMSNSGLIGNFVNCVLVDNDGTVFAGNYDAEFPNPGGISSFNGTTWLQYTPDNSGVPERYINRMSKDVLGNIWVMSATHGTAIFNPNGILGYECLDKIWEQCSPLALNAAESDYVDDLSYYPNPVTDVLHLLNSHSISDLEVYNLPGQRIMQKNINATEYSLDMSELSQGTYLLKINVGDSIKNIKVVKE